VVFPGDPAPEREVIAKISEGSPCNLSKISMCAHNGTHVDAPFHFYEKGKTIDETQLEKYIEAVGMLHDMDKHIRQMEYDVVREKSLLFLIYLLTKVTS
jgi:kynurenine formamidase